MYGAALDSDAELVIPMMVKQYMPTTMGVIFTLGMILAVTVVSLVVGIVYPEVYLLTAFSFDLILACLFIPLTLGLWWKKANATGALAAMIVGAAYRIIAPGIVEGFTFESITYPLTRYYYTVFAPVISLVVMVVVSLATQKKDEPRPLAFGSGGALPD